MSDLNEHRDQAEPLRERMNEKQQDSIKLADALSLPPRSKVHHVKDEKKKTKFKFRFPLLRLLTFLFILLPIAILGYTYHQDRELPTLNNLSSSNSSHSEEISIGTKKENKGLVIENEDEIVEEKEHDIEEAKSEEPEVNEDLQTAIDQQEDQPTEDTTDYNIVYHKVKSGETLYSISQHYYKNRAGEELIKEWNNLSNNNVEHGKVLKIPLKASK
jgi:LysM repeat protein